MTPHFSSDRPSQTDSFNRTDFAKSFAKSLCLPSGSSGLVVGLEGEWGCGKTTLLGFVKNELKQTGFHSRPIIIDFNPWMLSGANELVDALLLQVAARIGADTGGENKGLEVSKKLVNFIGSLKYTKYLPGCDFVANIVEDAQKAANTALEDIEKVLPAFDLQQKKTEVVDAIHELNRPLVIFIDDIDRLPATEIRTMLQVIKAVADFPRTTYLLAYDAKVVAAALTDQGINGTDYLEKIVQVAYPIPAVSPKKMQCFLRDKQTELLKQLDLQVTEFEAPRFEEVDQFVVKLMRHPRDVVRLLNRLILCWPAIDGDVNKADVLLFEALSQRYSEFREIVIQQPSAFIGTQLHDELDEQDPNWDSYFDAANTGDSSPPSWTHLPASLDHELAKESVSCLFKTQPTKSGSDTLPSDSLSLANSTILTRYLRFTSLEDVPDATEIHVLLAHPKDLQRTLNEPDEQKCCSTLGWLEFYIPSCTKPKIQECIEVLAAFSNQCGDSFSRHVVRRMLGNCIIALLKKEMDMPNRIILFNNVVANTSLAIAGYVVLSAAQDSEICIVGHPRDIAVKDRLISDENAVRAIIQSWLRRVEDLAGQGQLYEQRNLRSILHRYTQLHEHKYEAAFPLITSLLATDQGLETFLNEFSQTDLRTDSFLVQLIQNAEEFAGKVESSIHSQKYAWLSAYLRKPAVIEQVNKNTQMASRNRQYYEPR